MAINATLIICDDIRIEITGKSIIIGMYTGNLSITEEPSVITKLMFLFNVDIPLPYIPTVVTVEVTIPGVPVPLREEVKVPPPAAPIGPEHTRWIFRHAIGMQNITARSGKIVARVWVDDQELEISSALIVVGEPSLEESSTALPPPVAQSEIVDQK